jgi:hypothetical protein
MMGVQILNRMLTPGAYQNLSALDLKQQHMHGGFSRLRTFREGIDLQHI